MVSFARRFLLVLSVYLLPVHGRLSPTQPGSNTLYTAGDTALVTWTDDSHRPSLNDTGPLQIDLYAGNSTRIATLARNIPANALSTTVTIPSDLPFNIADYIMRFTATDPVMSVDSADFIIVSATGPSVVIEDDDDGDIITSAAPATVTVTRTRTTPTQPPVITVTVTAPPQLTPVAPPQRQASTVIEIVDGSLILTTDDGLIEETVDASFITATSQSVLRGYPIFISRLTVLAPTPTDPPIVSASTTGSSASGNTSTTTSGDAASSTETGPLSSVDSSAKAKITQSAGAGRTCRPTFRSYTMALLWSALVWVSMTL